MTGVCGYCGAGTAHEHHRLCWPCWREENAADGDGTDDQTQAFAAAVAGVRRASDDPQLSLLADTKSQRCPVCSEPGLTISEGTFGIRVLCARGCDRALILSALKRGGQT